MRAHPPPPVILTAVSAFERRASAHFLRGRHASCHRVVLDSRTAAAIAGSGGRMDGTAWQCSHPPPSARKTQQLVDHVCAVLSDLPSTIVAVYAGSAQLRDRSYSGGGSMKKVGVFASMIFGLAGVAYATDASADDIM